MMMMMPMSAKLLPVSTMPLSMLCSPGRRRRSRTQQGTGAAASREKDPMISSARGWGLRSRLGRGRAAGRMAGRVATDRRLAGGAAGGRRPRCLERIVGAAATHPDSAGCWPRRFCARPRHVRRPSRGHQSRPENRSRRSASHSRPGDATARQAIAAPIFY